MAEHIISRTLHGASIEHINQVMPDVFRASFGDHGHFVPLAHPLRLVVARQHDTSLLLQGSGLTIEQIDERYLSVPYNTPIDLHTRQVSSLPVRTENGNGMDRAIAARAEQAGHNPLEADKIMLHLNSTKPYTTAQLKELFRSRAPGAKPNLNRPQALLLGWRFNPDRALLHHDEDEYERIRKLFAVRVGRLMATKLSVKPAC